MQELVISVTRPALTLD